ncbi:MAG: FMN-binding protein [Deltaproteobacteria bacterium]|nr:FMN-binding protein [Deltaproteobacteria bacterium]
MRSRRTALGLIFVVALGSLPAAAEVFASKQEALAAAFPTADRVEHRSEVLDDSQAEQIEQSAHSALESRLVTLYTAWKGERVEGYAFIDIHTVRTQPEAFLVVLSPEGQVRSVRMLAFYEPPEYRPPNRWLKQFRALSVEWLQPDRTASAEIHGIAGSTLSARAVTSGVRRSLAFYELLVGSSRSGVVVSESTSQNVVGGGGR